MPPYGRRKSQQHGRRQVAAGRCWLPTIMVYGQSGPESGWLPAEPLAAGMPPHWGRLPAEAPAKRIIVMTRHALPLCVRGHDPGGGNLVVQSAATSGSPEVSH